ncbi:Glycosyltransferase [hydrothermal vent metagenome]|uniref:Glycosyltransferase n=1 Tax=hydrothermal vent metagenome TaxID=652676 RepID=A0A1W1D3H7_9ZZZZ
MIVSKKILILADPDSIHTKKWAEGWESLGYDCVISGLSSKKFDNQFIFYANLIREGGNAKVFLQKIFAFQRVLKKVNPDIINVHYLTSYGFIASLIKRKKDKMVLSLHGTDVMQTMDKNIVYLFLAKFIFYRSDLIVSVSHEMTKKILYYFPNVKEKIITQQYGINLEFLNQFQTENKEIDILTNRGWVKNSNYEIILETLIHFVDYSLAIIGDDDSFYAKELKKKFSSLHPFIYKQLPYEKNLTFIARSKVFISLTTSDGTPLSLLEAMYLGAIPIVSDIKSIHEIIKDGVNGFIIPIEKEKLYKTINLIFHLPQEKIKKIQMINKNLVQERFDRKKNFQLIDRLL